MYSRVFRRFLLVSGQLPSKYETVVKSQGFFSPLLQTPGGNSGRTFFTGLRHCNSQLTPDKDAKAQKRIDEWILNPDNEKQWKVLQLEVDVHRQNGNPVPEVLKPRHWLELTLLDSRNKRRKYLEFLFGIEKKKEHGMEKKRLAKEEREKYLAKERDPSLPPVYLDYCLGRNSPFLRFFDSTINQLGNWRLMKAMMYGQKIVMDCGYEHEMTRTEARNCARQMMLTWAANREHLDPFDLHFCNLNVDGDLHSNFLAFIPTMYDDDFPMNVTSKSYLDLFDKKQLVYLTPDTNVELREFSYDDIYIIGALVDKLSGRPLSMAKAKREGLRMAKLPIDRYLHFGGGGNKCLTLNQMISILLDINASNDWEYALRHVPQRKLFHNRQQHLQNRVNKFIKHSAEQASVFSSGPPQDFSLKSRKKFRVN
ncbi:mitochondrial ribonuclease P protein 1 homolog [Fopius arisanus]|uniref:RNA (guanine-9-)-methyltransferase domain-containing protein 1 n=1 Tax=Fopius arisanus TaxID=64838 RepID=A0A9R1TEW5_9HYME|nr:PREDICTED: mitochondrial ribonuclease P protein 1 homolog [Fopius arisanus]